MRIAIEDKQNRIAFYRIDGRSINKLIEKAKRDIKGLRIIWSYDYIEKLNNSNVGYYVGVKKLYE